MTHSITIATAGGGLFKALISTIEFLSRESTHFLALSKIGSA